MPRNAPRIEMPEEKEFTRSFALFPASRAPLNSIPDPSQLQKTTATHLSDLELAQKFQGRGGGANPRIVNRKARSRSEPNSSLVRELDEIQAGLGRYLKFDQIQSDFVASPTSGAEQVNQAHKHSTAETMSTIGENKEEVCFSDSKNCSGINDDTDNPDDNRVQIINESQDVLEENDGSMNNKSSMEREAVPRIEGHDDFELSGMVNNRDAVMKADEGADRSVLQFKLRKVIKDLEEAKTLNSQYEKEHKLLLSQQQIESIVCSFPQVKRKNRATKMTSRLPFFFSVFLYTVTTLVSTASGATSCRTSCGSIQINYPFGIDKGCGSPQFNGMLNCSSTDLFFFTPSGGYKVRSINYDKNTMLVFDPLMSTCSILQPHHDFKLSDIQNALIRPSYDTVFALFNCSNVSPVQNRYKSLCFNSAGHSCDELYSSCTSFRIFNTTSPYGNSSTVHTTPYCCFTSYDTVRVMSMNILDCSHYTTVIDDGKMKGVAPIDWSYGIELSYSAPEIGCSLCQKSGGTCGYDDETEIFLCQCSNNVSPRDCGGVSDQGGCNSTKANYPMLFLVMLVSFICAIL